MAQAFGTINSSTIVPVVGTIVLPVDGDFAWINQETATVTAENNGITLTTPASAGHDIRLRKKAAPATPYTITALIHPLMGEHASGNAWGIGFRQSSDGKLALVYVGDSSGSVVVAVQKFTDPNTFSATYVIKTIVPATGVIYPFTSLWLRIADDGVNRISSLSWDGIQFYTLHSVGRTDFLTADEIGFFVNSATASAGVTISLYSWRQT